MAAYIHRLPLCQHAMVSSTVLFVKIQKEGLLIDDKQRMYHCTDSLWVRGTELGWKRL